MWRVTGNYEVGSRTNPLPFAVYLLQLPNVWTELKRRNEGLDLSYFPSPPAFIICMQRAMEWWEGEHSWDCLVSKYTLNMLLFQTISRPSFPNLVCFTWRREGCEMVCQPSLWIWRTVTWKRPRWFFFLKLKRSNGLMLQERRFRLDIKTHFLAVREIWQWKHLSQNAANCPSLEILRRDWMTSPQGYDQLSYGFPALSGSWIQRPLEQVVSRCVAILAGDERNCSPPGRGRLGEYYRMLNIVLLFFLI